MRKNLLSLIALVLSLCMLVTLAACSKDNKNDNKNDGTTTENTTPNEVNATTPAPSDGSSNNGSGNTEIIVPPTHDHEFNRQKTYIDHIAENATCTSPALYYYSCSCGELGTQTFVGENVANCKYENGACIWCGKAEPAETEGLIFTSIKNGEAYILTGYEGTASEIYIPSTHNQKPVIRVSYGVFQEDKNVTSVVIGNNIKYIDSNAFADCVNLTSVVIGCDVQEIGEYAFGWCEKLQTVNLPDALTLIDKGAFWMCSSLSSVTLPYGLTQLGEDAFGRCDSLTSVMIPDSVTSIERKAFSWCLTLESIEVDEDNEHYSSLQGNLYNKDQTTILQYAMGKTDTDFAIPASVTTVGYYAFTYCENLVNLEIPNSVTDIHYGAFREMSGVKYNTKEGLNYLGNEENPYLYLAGVADKSITVAKIDSNCRFVGDSAFTFCTKLTGVIFGKDSKVTSIGTNAFFYCGSFASITIPASVTSLHAPFYACPNLTSIAFENAENWYFVATRDDFVNGVEGTAVDVSDSAANVANFSGDHEWYSWYK
jgi:hypothetical protein